MLSQDSEGGLEAKLPGSSKWKRVGHLPGAILINTGEILSIWSQQRYPALLHRVIIPEQESVRVRGRHSMAFFCHPGKYPGGLWHYRKTKNYSHLPFDNTKLI